ncbi:hypothetical protein KFL_002710120 [Klebsormidium nitens]|uniref:WW domain-containing protein n=1 Tax=Klebsormidium nitens TaxID=105231 RepID=A0A1Y1IBL4_KLENI|nr:hypothetical protein KFL_002710120 [Klebsormidium nitens]|eukprot:GAQ86117.1 hypothetical protein KFL_002710120 [Klebsormidium nitens]
MGRKRDRKQSNAVLGGGAGGRRVKLDLWTPDPIAEARKAREAASAAAPAEAQEAAAEDRAPLGAPSDNGEATTGGPKLAETAPSGLRHLIGAYSEDEEDEASPQEEAAAPAGAPGEDVDDKVKSFLAELETDGLLEEGEEAAVEEDQQPTETGGVTSDHDSGAVALGHEVQRAGGAGAGESERDDGEGEDEFVEEGWQAILDPGSGEHYYWNTLTLETTWDKPRTIKRRRGGDPALAPQDEAGDGSGVAASVEPGEAGQGGQVEEQEQGGETQPEGPSVLETGREEGSEGGLNTGEKKGRLLEGITAEGLGADREEGDAAGPLPSKEDVLESVPSTAETDGAVTQGRVLDDEALPAVQRKVVEVGATSDEAIDSGDTSEASDSEDQVDEDGHAADAREAGPQARGQGSTGERERVPGSVVRDDEKTRSEQEELVSGLLQEGAALVRRLQERAGPSLAHVSPLARLAIQAETVSSLALKLQTANSANTIWARICEQLLLLSARATEMEGMAEGGRGTGRTEGETQGGSDGPHTDEEIEALLEDVEPNREENFRDRETRPESSGATGMRLFPIPYRGVPLTGSSAGEGSTSGMTPEVGSAQLGGQEERTPSKAELLQRKTADLQKRMAAIQAFKTPASEPPAEATALVGLAGYGSEMEDGEIAPSDEAPTSEGARPASRSGRSEKPSGEDDMGIDNTEGRPEAGVGAPGQLRSTLQQLLALGASLHEQSGQGATRGVGTSPTPPPGAAAYPEASLFTPQNPYPNPPPMPYNGAEAAPEPPSYDPFAEAHPPPPPASPPPEDTWPAQPPFPPEEALLLEPQPPLSIVEAAVVPVVEPPQVQGPVLFAPPVRVARPLEAVPKVEQPKSVAEAAAAAAGAAAGSRKAKPKKPASAPVGRGLSSAKKVSSLMDKWKAAAQDAQPRKEGPLSAEELERQKAAELEEWRRQQIASGEADKNANFAPVEGDWRKRVKKAQKQAEREARQAAAPSVSPPHADKPDLAALAKGLQPGWQPFLDPGSGDVYYGNLRTSETTWTRPAG